MIQIIVNAEPKIIKKMILALLKSKLASRILAQDYVKSYIMIDTKILKTHHKILYIYTEKTSEQIKWFVDKSFSWLKVEFL